MSRKIEGFYICLDPEGKPMPMNDEGDLALIEDKARCEYAFLWSPNSPSGIRMRKEGYKCVKATLTISEETEEPHEQKD